MKKTNFIILILLVFRSICFAQETVTISGNVTDFESNPIDSCSVFVMSDDFSDLKEALTSKDGFYSVKVEKGKYMAMGSIRMDEYPIAGSVLPDGEQRLEFWAWNIIADRDITMDMRYHRLEIYGVNVFYIQGAYPGYMIYFRPMSLSRFLSVPKEKRTVAAIVPPQNDFKVEVYFDDEPVEVNLIQKVAEYSEGESGEGYLLHVARPKNENLKPYQIVKIVGMDLANGDKGEAIYFNEKKNYK